MGRKNNEYELLPVNPYKCLGCNFEEHQLLAEAENWAFPMVCEKCFVLPKKRKEAFEKLAILATMWRLSENK